MDLLLLVAMWIIGLVIIACICAGIVGAFVIACIFVFKALERKFGDLFP